MNTGPARERISSLLFYGTVLLLAYLLFLLFRPFFAPLAWAAILAAVFHPLHHRLEARLGRTGAAAVSTALVTFVIIVPVLLIATGFVEEATQAMESVNFTLQTEGFARLQRIWDSVRASGLVGNLGDLDELVKEAATRLAGVVAGQAGNLLRNVVLVVVDLVVMLFAVFFFFRDGDAFMAAVRRVLPFDTVQSERMITEARDLIYASVIASLIVAIIQGAMGGVAFAVLGLGAPVFWGVLMAFFSLLPLVGAWVVWAPAAAWLLLTGSVGRGLALIAIGAGVISLVDNFLRPALLSGRTQLNGLLVFISLLGGISAFGFVGLVFGPVIMATTIGVFDAYTKDRRGVRRSESGLIQQ